MGDYLLLDVFVPGLPAPQGSKRYLGVGSKGGVRMAESSKKVEPWRADIRNAIGNQLVMRCENGPVAVELYFHLPRPASVPIRLREYPHVRPDLDKLVRAVLDAVGSSGQVWKDDSQVCHINAWKTYATADEPVGVQITVRSLA